VSDTDSPADDICCGKRCQHKRYAHSWCWSDHACRNISYECNVKDCKCKKFKENSMTDLGYKYKKRGSLI
jgi:hypothetical protein